MSKWFSLLAFTKSESHQSTYSQITTWSNKFKAEDLPDMSKTYKTVLCNIIWPGFALVQCNMTVICSPRLMWFSVMSTLNTWSMFQVSSKDKQSRLKWGDMNTWNKSITNHLYQRRRLTDSSIHLPIQPHNRYPCSWWCFSRCVYMTN